MVIVSHSVVEVACFPLWFDMLKATTIIPQRGMLSILCFFFTGTLWENRLLFFFRRGQGIYLVQSVNRSPTLWLEAWVNECMMLLESWASRPSIRLPWPLMTRIDAVIQSWTFHKLSVKVGGEKVFFPHLIFNHSNPTFCSICTTDINDSWSHHVYTIFTWWTIKRTLKSHNCSLKKPYLQIRILQWLWDELFDPAPEQNALAMA